MTISVNPGNKPNIGTPQGYMNYPAQAAPGYTAYPGYMQGYPSYPSYPQQQQVPPPVPSGIGITPGGQLNALPLEESYVENILRLNLGKVGTFYMTFENNSEWNAKIFRGVVEAAGRDHIIISDPKTGMRYLLLMVNLDYATFDEPLNYFNTPIQPR
ncbi:spore coat protein GerQ [Paenibacillus lutrae]|uniref:Spore coat protein GerQ n=1 Tax=Paenibacillus lutrae TaxID=2078573 RepID=A0A7X3FLN8_9BACL|nr:spore coat protein GerQ [Paenibacillus lutrae]